MAKVKKYQAGGKTSLGMKSVKAGYDSNPGVTRADIIVAAKKQAKGGASLKPKAASAANVSKKLGSRLRAGGTLSPTTSSVSRRLASPFKNKKAKGGATLSPKSASTSNRLASNLKLKKGGKVAKKAMGGTKLGGKCRGGCY